MSSNQDSRVVQVYLFFRGHCEQALAFYQKALGAQVEMLMRYKDSPEPVPPGMLAPGWENKVMHCSFRVGQSVVMASDGCGTETGGFHGFSMSISVKTEAEADQVFAALSDGGKVTMPLSKTFWCARFGMLEDRFGIGWMISVAPAVH